MIGTANRAGAGAVRGRGESPASETPGKDASTLTFCRPHRRVQICESLAMARVIAIDWSGAAAGAKNKIWIAEALAGELLFLEDGRSREQVVDWLIERRTQVPEAIVGIDFAFSYPRWFLDAHDCTTVDALWELVGEHGEDWLTTSPAPFWGRPGKRRGEEVQLRQCEEGWNVRGIVPKSVFQIGGAGAVGTGTIRGIPHLSRLRAGGWAIWPFDGPSTHVAVEIWPRLLTGPVAKSSSSECRAWLDAHATLPAQINERASSSEDAFDAAASALVLSRCSDLSETLAAPLTSNPLEGSIFFPHSLRPPP